MCNRWIGRGLLAAGAFLLLGPKAMEAQSVEAIMRASERLELTDDQMQQLDAIRSEMVAERSAEMATIAELRSQLQAGQIRRSELMAAMEDQREARRTRMEERRASVDAILTDTQREAVQEMRRRADRQRPGARSRRDRPFGPNGRRGFGPSDFAPDGDGGFRPGNRAIDGSR